MATKDIMENVKNILEQFDFKGELVSCEPYGNGHINDTFLIEFNCGKNTEKYILQRINTNIFKNPDQVMSNIIGVTSYLRDILTEMGEDAERRAVRVIMTKDGKGCCCDESGTWRVLVFIDGCVSLDLPETDEDFYQVGVAFGEFQSMLDKYPAETLFETIPNFHNTPVRYETFLNSLDKNASGRVGNVSAEIEFVKSRAEFMKVLEDSYNSGVLPKRVTHNDTKMNNVMLDKITRKPVCVVDLDTIMPGYSVTDFGDAIRVGASTAVEDEQDLSKVHFDLHQFEIYTKGFLEACGKNLTEAELDLLPAGAKMMTLECGMRFLTDYIDGDTYFKTAYPEHNLVRCRTQFRLVEEMESMWDEMKAIVAKYK